MRKKLVAGNWKMNGARATASQLCAGIRDRLTDDAAADIVICPPYPLLQTAREALQNGRIALGAQDVDANENGAYTGQVSAAMLADAGCDYVIVGHSERRMMYNESDQLVARKVAAAVAAGLRPIICIGETLAEREAGQTEAVVARQLDAVLHSLHAAKLADAVFAYEPVWAIGSGQTATPAQAQSVHAFLRARLAAGDARLAECRIVYGGSMKPQNAAALLAQPDIDGGLLGGAALCADDFVAVCNAAAGI